MYKGRVRTGSTGSAEPAIFWDLLNGTLSKLNPVLDNGTRRSKFLTRPLFCFTKQLLLNSFCTGLYTRYNIIFAIFCHKSHNTMSNDTPYWSKRYHIQKWKIYYRFLAHSNDYVYNRGKDKLKHIQHWLWPLIFSIYVQSLPKVFEVFAIWSVVAKKLITYTGQTLLGRLQNCFYAF